MAKSSIKTGVIGSWAFLIGVVLAVIFGLIGNVNPLLNLILVIIGIVVGLLNVTEKETMPFLMSGAVLIIASGLGRLGENALETIHLSGVLNALLAIFVPATIIVAIRNVFIIAKD